VRVVSQSFLMRWAEETLADPASGKPNAVESRRPDLDVTQCQAAREFIGRAAARLVCPDCSPDCPPGASLAILVPPENDGLFFRDAVRTLKLDHLPIIPRRAPLVFRPEVEHQKRRAGAR
jgi:hypothetical protein